MTNSRGTARLNPAFDEFVTAPAPRWHSWSRKDGTKAATVGEAEKPVQITLRGVDHAIPD
jgi:hypothetical protein